MKFCPFVGRPSAGLRNNKKRLQCITKPWYFVCGVLADDKWKYWLNLRSTSQKIPFTVIYKATYTSRRLDNAYSSTIVWMEERYKLVLFSVAFFPISILKLKCHMVLIFLQTLRISLSATSIHVHYCIGCVEIFYNPLKKSFHLKWYV